MTRPIAYFLLFLFTTVFLLAVGLLFVITAYLIVSFVAWEWLVMITDWSATAYVFRFIIVIAIGIAAAFVCSDEAKKVIDEILADLKK